MNCNAEVQGRFCHICGQENVEPKESVLHLLNHYFQDITHFDGKFFSSLKYLITKPGFLSAEYIRGRRASYLNPIRMYVFTSAVFFLLFFIFIQPDLHHEEEKPVYSATKFVQKLETLISTAEGIRQVVTDTAKIRRIDARIAKYKTQLATVQRDSIAGRKVFEAYMEENGVLTIAEQDYSTLAEYDSIQRALPASARDNFLRTKLIRKSLEVKGKYKGAGGSLQERLLENFFHKFPQMLFISLPIFALFLYWLYSRRKRFYYADHIIFTIHLYIFTFLLMLVIMLLQQLGNLTHWDFLEILSTVLGLSVFVYQYKAMRFFYQQSRGKTILKFVLLNALALIVLLVLFIGFFLFSFFQT